MEEKRLQALLKKLPEMRKTLKKIARVLKEKGMTEKGMTEKEVED